MGCYRTICLSSILPAFSSSKHVIHFLPSQIKGLADLQVAAVVCDWPTSNTNNKEVGGGVDTICCDSPVDLHYKHMGKCRNSTSSL